VGEKSKALKKEKDQTGSRNGVDGLSNPAETDCTNALKGKFLAGDELRYQCDGREKGSLTKP